MPTVVNLEILKSAKCNKIRMRLFERFSNTVYLFCDGMEKSQAQQAPFFILPSLIDFGSSVLQRKQKAASVIKGLSGLF